MKNVILLSTRISFIIAYLLTTISFAQNCPPSDGGYYSGSFIRSSHQYLYPGLVPPGAPSQSTGSTTIGHIFFSDYNASSSQKSSITIAPTLDGSEYGKVLLNLFKLNFNANTFLRIYEGTDDAGTLMDEINSSNYSSKEGTEYLIDGPATLVFYGSTPNVDKNNIIRYLTGDISLATCNQNRTGLVWKDFISPNSYVIVDDQESSLLNESTPNYLFLPACVAYFDENKNFVRVESAFCIDRPMEAPTPGYWFYPGEYQYVLSSTTNYDIDRDGFDASIDNLKIGRILWLLKQAEGATTEVKGDIQLAVWDTQSYAVDQVFDAGSWQARAQAAITSVPSPAEPTFDLNFPNGETGKAIVNKETIDINIPFSWSATQEGQTNTVHLDLPTGVTIQSVTGGTNSGQNITITADMATVTLASSVEGDFTIHAVYDNPKYFNTNNLQVYIPCNSDLESQAFLHIGEENRASPFRSIPVSWAKELPVRLINFDVAAEANGAHLQWNTAEEVNFSHFEIEKGTDAKKWTTLTKVAGNSAGRYQFTDTNISGAKTTYYRLKMIDKDKTFAYSNIKSLYLKDTKFYISVFPNPVSSYIHLSNVDVNNVNNIQVYDSYGVLKLNSNKLPQHGLDVTSLVDGVYITNIQLKNGVSVNQKIVVKK